MRLSLGRTVVALAFVSALLGGQAAQADEKVKVEAAVVHASNKGAAVDPGLERLKGDLGNKFSALKLVSKEQVTLEKGKDAQVKMPGTRAANVKLLELKDDVASVSVAISDKGKQVAEARYKLAKGKSAIVVTGAHQDGVLVLVLSPPGGNNQPRRAILRPVRPVPVPAIRSSHPTLQP